MTTFIFWKYLNAADQCFHFIGRAAAESPFDDGLTCCRHHDHHGRVNYGARWQNGQNNEPEPQKDVDLLIEDVQGEHTERIVLLYAAWRSVFVENTFGDAWKEFDHRIASILLIHVGEAPHIRAVCHECSAQEFIDEDNVCDDIGQVQELTEKVAERVTVVCAHAFHDIVDQTFRTILTFAGRQCENTTQSLRNHAHFAIFPVLPNPMWHIEHASLSKPE